MQEPATRPRRHRMNGRRLPLLLSLATALAVMLAAPLEMRAAHAGGFGTCASGQVVAVTADGRLAPPDPRRPGAIPDALLFGLPSVLRAARTHPVRGRRRGQAS